MSDVDTERLIMEVQCRSELWNHRNEKYKDRDARVAAWLQIANELFENFDNLNADGKKAMRKYLPIYTNLLKIKFDIFLFVMIRLRNY